MRNLDATLGAWIARTVAVELLREGLQVEKVDVRGDVLGRGLEIAVRIPTGAEFSALCVGGRLVWADLIRSLMTDAQIWQDMHPDDLIIVRARPAVEATRKVFS